MRAAHAKSYGAGTVRERGRLAYAEHRRKSLTLVRSFCSIALPVAGDEHGGRGGRASRIARILVPNLINPPGKQGESA